MAINTQNNPQTLTAGVQLYTNKLIEELRGRLIPLTGFSTNFTDDFRQPGDSLQVPIIGADTADDFDEETNNFITEATSAKKFVTVKLGAHKIIKNTVTVDDVARFIPEHWEKKAVLNAEELAETIMLDIAAVPVSAKATQTHQLPATMDMAAIIDLAKFCDSKNISPSKSTLYLTPTEYYDLLKSLNFNATGQTVITQGSLGGINFGFSQIVLLPALATASFVGTPQLLGIAGKPYVGPVVGGKAYEHEQIVVEPNSGLPMVVTVVQNPATKAYTHNLDCWFGCEINDPKFGVKLSRASASA